MFSQPSLTGQPKPHTDRNLVKAILILIFVFVIVILFSLAVILSGRTATSPMQTPSPTPTMNPTTTQVPTSLVIVVSFGLLQPYNPKVRLGLKPTEKGRLVAPMRHYGVTVKCPAV